MVGRELEPRNTSNGIARARESLAGLPVDGLNASERELVMETMANLYAVEAMAAEKGLVIAGEAADQEQSSPKHFEAFSEMSGGGGYIYVGIKKDGVVFTKKGLINI